MTLIIIGNIIAYIWGTQIGVWPCVLGLLLWLINFVYKAFHWTEYARENMTNIFIILMTICLLFILLLVRV